MYRLLKMLTSRLVIIVPLVVLQFAFFVVIFYRVTLAAELMPFLGLLAVLMDIYILNREEDPAYKITWCIFLVAVPIIGLPMYLLFGNRHVPKKLYNGTVKANIEMDSLLKQDQQVLSDYDDFKDYPENIFRYGLLQTEFPVYRHTESRYFSSGEEWLPVYLEELKKAEHFIFIEFFIISPGTVWDEIYAVLKQKVQEGVEVKIIYDDFGSMLLPRHFDRELRRYGIEAYRFNRVRAALIIQMNNRDHRKITVIDNKTAFTGGLNLADEYANRIDRFGYWKDSAVMLKGEAVWTFTVMFLGMLSYCREWASFTPQPVTYLSYKLPAEGYGDTGLYQPFSDTPTDDEAAGLTMHINMVQHARKYVYIDTPYLILTETMKQALMTAAKSGVDVRILVPHIPDKALVNQITKGFYRQLIHAGVRIYEFTPGFNHAKNFVVDDEAAIVGTINTDYRSYFLHFENGVLMYHTPEIVKMREDFEQSLLKSHEVTEEEEKKVKLILRLIRGLLNFFIPLL